MPNATLDELYAARETIDQVAGQGPLGPHYERVSVPVRRVGGYYEGVLHMPWWNLTDAGLHDADGAIIPLHLAGWDQHYLWPWLGSSQGNVATGVRSQPTRYIRIYVHSIEDKARANDAVLFVASALVGWGRVRKIRSGSINTTLWSTDKNLFFAQLLADWSDQQHIGQSFVLVPRNADDEGVTFTITELADGQGRGIGFDYAPSGGAIAAILISAGA